MAGKLEDKKAELLDRVCAVIRDKLRGTRADMAERFARALYRNVAPSDLLDAELDRLVGAAISLWTFLDQRPVGTPKIRVYTPTLAEHGWRSVHSLVEIVNDDMPFLVDSVSAELTRHDVAVHLVIHPVLRVRRDAQGRLVELLERGAAVEGARDESVMSIEISEQTSDESRARIELRLAAVLADVRAAVEDWRTMRQRMAEAAVENETSPPAGLDAEEVAENCAFMRWAEGDHYTFLGYREYAYRGTGRGQRAEVVPGSGLGVLRDPLVEPLEGGRDLGHLAPEVRRHILAPRLLVLMKGDIRATVHRQVHYDTITVKRFDDKGKVVGERLFVGLFTSVAYSKSPRAIPLLRRKVDRIIARAGFAPASHDGKALAHTLENYPRDELLQISEDDLLDIAMGVLHLQERQRVALFVRRDALERYLSCMIYVPKDLYNSELRVRFQAVVEKAFAGRVTAHYAQIGDDPLARVHFIVKTQRGRIPDYDVREIEAHLVEAARTWTDKLRQALAETKGEHRGIDLMRRYGAAFPTAYRERFNAQAAIADMDLIEDVVTLGGLGMNLYRPIESGQSTVHFKVFHRGNPVRLSDIMPMLENMGFKVVSDIPYEVAPRDLGEPLWIHDFVMVTGDGRPVELGRVRQLFHEAFAQIWRGGMESDGFNRLVIGAGLGWREVVALRAFAKYLRQAAFPFSQSYIEDALANNPGIASAILQLFLARFDPGAQGEASARVKQLVADIQQGLDAVTNADEDRTLRRYLNLVQSMLRTNYFQTDADGRPKPYLSFKLDSRKLDELPLPRPLYEIFVYSPRVEAIHLRGGKVARGGIRWSDRREDFRTEILGLMKAQMVKNAVIVPVGSKGGFVVKRPPAEGGREAFLAEGIECYKTLMRGLLDVTDDIKAGKLVAPRDVVRLDGDDPYLVVAADKGTATFSDIANAVSRDYGFWLDDAFASGGSAGYDHKKMAITARGAWEAVKRHFRELGLDIQSQDFTCVGIGDMSGDVFGNGMLLSPHTRLIVAFNHLHVFVDPDPDPAASFAERKRLFDLPRSSWADYDAKLISKGGGVFDRRAKTVPISAEMRALLDIDRDLLTPNELIRHVLRARVDLLYFGGIGTYVKAAGESHGEAGDRANDGVRVNGRELRCRVLGEGANLGCTQRGRVEFARAGGRLNTDAIDNSAGVDCSDHEVNLKILLGAVVDEGDLTIKQRDQMLAEMTDEVGLLVLRDNYLQTQAISFAERQGVRLLDQQQRLMRALERLNRLDRGIEYLPSDEVIEERRADNAGLTRPEIAVLLSYSKMWIYDELLPSDVPDDRRLSADSVLYFPRRIGQAYPDAVSHHRLRREITATYMTNSLVNRAGPTFVNDLIESTGMAVPMIARAYAIARDVFSLRNLWRAIESLDNRVGASTQHEMLLMASTLIERGTTWFLRNGKPGLDIADNIAAYSKSVGTLAGQLGELLPEPDRKLLDERAGALEAKGVPAETARTVASLDVLTSACDITRIAEGGAVPGATVARAYYAVGFRFGIDWLRGQAERLATDSHWQNLAVAAVVDDLFSHQDALTRRVLAGGAGEGVLEAWTRDRRAAVDRVDRLIADLRAQPQLDLSMLAVANGQLRALVSAP